MDSVLRIKLEENRNHLAGLKQKMKSIYLSLQVENKQRRLRDILDLEKQEDIWKDQQKAAALQREKAILESITLDYASLEKQIGEYEILEQFALDEDDLDSAQEAEKLYETLEKEINDTEQRAYLSEEMDPNNAIVSINAGAGGTESCDWAYMLARMIIRFAESKKFKLKTLSVQEGDSAGIKSMTLTVEGTFAYGILKSESGIHRLVRISPFDSNARRHTSFASIYVSPEVDDSIEIEILDKDIKIDVYRSGGAGGQSVNTTDSAVRITHFPSGLVVTCQNERSQLQNKLSAMKVLKSRLYEREMAIRREKKNQIESEKREIAWGSQIRSYVLHPYKLVKDHRTGYESNTAEKVLEGDLDPFIKQYLQWLSIGKCDTSE
jgi:peptide chain release factor 2